MSIFQLRARARAGRSKLRTARRLVGSRLRLRPSHLDDRELPIAEYRRLMADFKKLLVYQKARRLAKRMAEYYPRIRKRNRRLADQLERAIESVGDAIAEGRGPCHR